MRIVPLLSTIEYILATKFRPSFLAVIPPMDEEDDEIHVLISSAQFNTLTVNERITKVFNEIYKQLPNIGEDFLLVIRAYSSEEIDEVLDDIFDEELR